MRVAWASGELLGVGLECWGRSKRNEFRSTSAGRQESRPSLGNAIAPQIWLTDGNGLEYLDGVTPEPMATPEELKGTCSACGGGLQFPPDARGQEIDCPHCGARTKLEVAAAEESLAAEQPIDALKAGIAGIAKAASLTAKKASEKAKELKDSDKVQELKEKAGRAAADVKARAEQTAVEAAADPGKFRKRLAPIGVVVVVLVLFVLFKAQPWKSEFERALSRADGGNAAAQHLVASMYLRGEGVEKDVGKAVQFYSAAAEQGFVDAQVNLGSMYLQGLGVEADAAEGFRHFGMAAELGDEIAKSVVGELLWRGQGVARNPGEARRWLEESDELANSRFYLGLMSAMGEGTERDIDEAIDRLEDAADQGHAEASGALGFIYLTDAGEKDEKKAVKHLERGVKEGSAQAMHLLGICYREGLGVRRDKTRALDLIENASAKGCREAEGSLRQLDVEGGASLLQPLLRQGLLIFDPGRRADYDQTWEQHRR